MKRLTALVLALALLLSLTACVEKPQTQNIYYGKYLCYMISCDGDRSGGNGEWLLLKPDGTGQLCITEEVEIEWERSGEQEIKVTTPDSVYKGILYPYDKELMLGIGDLMLFFSTDGKNHQFPTEATQRSPYTEPTETEAPSEPDYSAAYVTDAVKESFALDGMQLEYHVPEIIFDGEGIDYINEMIYEQLYTGTYQEQVVDAMQEYDMPGIAFINYLWGRADHYLSIVVTVTPYASEGAEFTIYNVDLSTGELASESEILAHFGYTTDDFSDRAKSVMGSVVFDQYASFLKEVEADASLKPLFDDLVIRTTSYDYVSQASPFIGADGKLWTVAPIASIAGADFYPQVIPFADYPISDAYLNYSFG